MAKRIRRAIGFLNYALLISLSLSLFLEKIVLIVCDFYMPKLKYL